MTACSCPAADITPENNETYLNAWKMTCMQVQLSLVVHTGGVVFVFLFPSSSGMMLFTWWFPGERTYTNQHIVQAISFCATAYINNFPRSHGIYIFCALRFSYDKMMMPSKKAVISGPGLICRFAVMILGYPLKFAVNRSATVRLIYQPKSALFENNMVDGSH